MSAIRVIVADDHPLVLRGIADFVDSHADFEVIARCMDGGTALDAVRRLKPDIALLDVSMPKLDGLTLLATFNREMLGIRTVFLSADLNSRQIMTAMAEGAWGILVKDCTPDELLDCLRKVSAGQKYLPFGLFERFGRQEPRADAIPIEKLLTASEWSVAALAAQGLTNKEISRKLKITEGTAKIHLHHVFKKLKISNRTTLAQMAFRHADDFARPR